MQHLVSTDAHTLVGDVACNTYPQTQPQLDWSYTLGTSLTISLVGSADVKTYTVP